MDLPHQIGFALQAGLPMLREKNVQKGFFEHGDFSKLRKALPEHLRGFITFAYKTDWRLGT